MTSRGLHRPRWVLRHPVRERCESRTRREFVRSSHDLLMVLGVLCRLLWSMDARQNRRSSVYVEIWRERFSGPETEELLQWNMNEKVPLGYGTVLRFLDLLCCQVLRWIFQTFFFMSADDSFLWMSALQVRRCRLVECWCWRGCESPAKCHFDHTASFCSNVPAHPWERGDFSQRF